MFDFSFSIYFVSTIVATLCILALYSIHYLNKDDDHDHKVKTKKHKKA